jgi:hypothetical protein
VLAAPGATDNYYVRLDSTGTYVQISNSNAPLPTPTYQIAWALLPSLTFNLLGGANTVWVDFSDGSPIPPGEILVNGSAGAADALTVIGQNSAQAFTLASAQIEPTGGPAIAYSNIASLLLQNGTTSFSGTIQPGPALTVGGGATLGGAGTLDRSVTLLGGSLAGPMTIDGDLTSIGGTVSPGAGTLNVVGNVALDQGTTLNYQLSAPNVSGGGNDLIDIIGNLTLGGTLEVIGPSGFGAGAYTLFDYTGSLSGAGLTIGANVPGGGYNYRLLSGGGQINLVASLWALGDVNHDGVIDSLDIDAIYAHFGSVTANLALAPYDLGGDNVVSQADVTYELANILHRAYGDANLDGAVDFLDFQDLLNHWQSQGAGWAGADFNGDGVTDFLDFQTLLNNWNPAGTGTAIQTADATTTVSSTATPANAILISQPEEQSAATAAAGTVAAASPAASTAGSTSTDSPAVETASPILQPATSGDVSQATGQNASTGNSSPSHRTPLADAEYPWDDSPVDLLTHFHKPNFAWPQRNLRS